MVLLDMLVKQATGDRYIVAHFDHGIRPDSAQDRQLVQGTARRYGLPFVYDTGRLGSDSSEDTARQARYAFLHSVRHASGARAVVTAHHRDDVLETAVHNLLRGTGRRGLVSMRSYPHVHRPLLEKTKRDIVAYAKEQGLVWREDSTNSDMRYRRNYIRHKILPKLSDEQKTQLLQHIRNVQKTHDELENQLANYLHVQPAARTLDRHWFVMLPHRVAREVLATWLRDQDLHDISSDMIERLVVAAKTYAPGKHADVAKGLVLYVDRYTLALGFRDR
jgi:tRNA(Ile)-lysidine synthase